MARSLFQQHRARVLGAAAAVAAAVPALRSGEAATEYELQRARLGVDLRRLHEIQSIEKKIELKRELLPGYQEWVAGVLAADVPAQDDVLVQVMIWTIDVGHFANALLLARHVLRHRLALPERFKRTPATLIAEEIADAALKTLGRSEDLYPGMVAAALADLEATEILVDGEDMFDEVRAKLTKAIGLATVKLAELTEENADGPAGGRRARLAHGLNRLRRAYELDEGCGVKGEINRLERELKKVAPADDAGA